jgi:hypothetical protein
MADLTDTAIDEALARGRAVATTEPRAAGARYEMKSRRIVIDLQNGCTFAFPAAMAQGLENASDQDLAEIEILGNG